MINPLDEHIDLDLFIELKASEFNRSGILIYLSDPEASQNIAPESLRDVYSLTPKEAQVAVGIANGMTLKAIAGSLNTSEKTVQTQLKSVFRKVGVNRQQDLINLLVSSALNINQ